jgi:hypothetical protein
MLRTTCRPAKNCQKSRDARLLLIAGYTEGNATHFTQSRKARKGKEINPRGERLRIPTGDEAAIEPDLAVDDSNRPETWNGCDAKLVDS